MKTKVMVCAMGLLLSVLSGSAIGGFEGNYNTFYGKYAGTYTTGDDDYNTFIGSNAGTYTTDGEQNIFLGFAAGYSNTAGSYNAFLGFAAGYSNTTGNHNTFIGFRTGFPNTTGYYNTFLGDSAGYSNTAGHENTFIGNYAGFANTTENGNTYIGYGTGRNTTGSGNVFIGYRAGYHESGSNRLYIDNSNTSTPLIYGEFDTRNLIINGNLEIIGPYQGLVYLSDNTTDNTTKVSRMVLNHYSNSQLPVYLFGAASTSTNNFVAFGGGNPIGNAATQIDLFTAPNTTTPTGTSRITIKGNGYVGIGTQSPSYPLQMAGGAYTNGTSWVDISSLEYKENIEALSTEEALEAIKELHPVKYAYKADTSEKRVGFISEEVPELIAMKDRKGLSPMDIVAVLTKVVQEQQRTISALREELNELKERVR